MRRRVPAHVILVSILLLCAGPPSDGRPDPGQVLRGTGLHGAAGGGGGHLAHRRHPALTQIRPQGRHPQQQDHHDRSPLHT